MDRQLSAAVLATFQEASPSGHASRLRQFSARRWRHGFRWLDASGLALYFLHRLREFEIEDAIPEPVLSQLEQRHADNEQRTAAMFNEVTRINTLFHHAGVRYANLKGFTLVPEFCSDLSLRYQSDSDFLIEHADGARCESVLHELGYVTIASNDQVIELKTDAGHTPSIRDLYKAKPQRCAELHFCDTRRRDRHPGLLNRARLVRVDDRFYPALSLEDSLLSHASHLFRHLRSEWTRVSWLLEFRHFVARYAVNVGFWRKVLQEAAKDREAAVGFAAVLRLAEKTFGRFSPGELTEWSSHHLPRPVELWIDQFGEDLLLAEFPGSKLYLLLEQALHGAERPAANWQRLVPRRAPAPIVAPPSHGLRPRMAAAVSQWSYLFFRLRFHLVANVRYFMASRRWKRLKAPAESTAGYMATTCATNHHQG